jgi:RNA polymerase sigma-54 factor
MKLASVEDRDYTIHTGAGMFQLHYSALRPQTTAHLAQTMTLLSLTADELRQQIESELASNPALEMVEERRCPVCHRMLGKGVCPVCSQPKFDQNDEPVVFISPREDFFPTGNASGSADLPEDTFSSSCEELPEYVLRQIAPDLSKEDRRLAAYLLTHLDEDGLLTISLMEVARYFHIPLGQVEHIQRIIQRADPLGVGSCSTQEALLVQLEMLSDGQAIPEMARQIVREGMDFLSRRQYSELARQFKVSLRQIQPAVKFISDNLNPFPARSHWGDVRQPTASNLQVYHRPDIIISHQNESENGPLVVEIIMPVAGTLRVNPLFKDAVRGTSGENKEAWKGDLERASLFVKCIQQRNHTMQRLLQRVVSIQKEFILNGDKYLKPITRASFSRELEVHESTISRAVSNKTVQLPNRKIIPMADFFDRSLNVRTVLKDIIAAEPHPLSDTELAFLLEKNGFNVARRTVAKYRAMEGILPAHLRHVGVAS